MLIVMIVAGIAVALCVTWYLLARGSRATTVSEGDFDAVYDELVTEGRLDGNGDRDAAWRDFDSWQAGNEKERLAWEQPPDE